MLGAKTMLLIISENVCRYKLLTSVPIRVCNFHIYIPNKSWHFWLLTLLVQKTLYDLLLLSHTNKRVLHICHDQFWRKKIKPFQWLTNPKYFRFCDLKEKIDNLKEPLWLCYNYGFTWCTIYIILNELHTFDISNFPFKEVHIFIPFTCLLTILQRTGWKEHMKYFPQWMIVYSLLKEMQIFRISFSPKTDHYS